MKYCICRFMAIKMKHSKIHLVWLGLAMAILIRDNSLKLEKKSICEVFLHSYSAYLHFCAKDSLEDRKTYLIKKKAVQTAVQG